MNLLLENKIKLEILMNQCEKTRSFSVLSTQGTHTFDMTFFLFSYFENLNDGNRPGIV